MNRLRILLILAAALLLCTVSVAKIEQFTDGERVCFVGDSITHGGSYHTIVYLFYATRFPDRDIRMYNCGISGDTAGGTIRRFNSDIVPKKPTTATVMLGMNDVGRNAYKEGVRSESDIASGKKSLEAYANNMDKLSAMLKAQGTKLIFIAPSIYDQTAKIESENNFGVNDALRICGDDCRELSRKYGGGFVDFNTPMLEINARQQADDPAFTIVGPDRVHPKALGHFVMAYTFLEAQGVGQYVSKTVIDAKNVAVTESVNCKVSQVKAGDDGLSYECVEGSLPFPVAAIPERGLEFADITQLNKEVIEVAGLKQGQYKLLIDGQLVGEYSNSELEAGVDISANVNTPQYKQAMEVYELNNERADASYILRSLALVEYHMLKEAIDGSCDLEQIKERLNSVLVEMKGKSWYNYYASQVDRYIENKPRQDELNAKVENLIDRMYEVNQPKNHSYQLLLQD